MFFFFQAEDGIRDLTVTGVQTCALPILDALRRARDGCAVADPDRAIPRREQARERNAPLRRRARAAGASAARDRKSGVEGKSVDLGGRRIIKKKKRPAHEDYSSYMAVRC